MSARLRVGLIGSGDDNSNTLLRLLVEQGIQIVHALEPKDLTEQHIRDSHLDVWLLDLDDAHWHNKLDELMDHSNVPIFFNEHQSIAQQAHLDYWARNLITRMEELAGDSDMPVTANEAKASTHHIAFSKTDSKTPAAETKVEAKAAPKVEAKTENKSKPEVRPSDDLTPLPSSIDPELLKEIEELEQLLQDKDPAERSDDFKPLEPVRLRTETGSDDAVKAAAQARAAEIAKAQEAARAQQEAERSAKEQAERRAREEREQAERKIREQQEAERLAAERAEAERQAELKRQEEARLAAEREAARRAEEARLAAEKAEAERQAEIQRQQEAARREAERLEALRQEELRKAEEARKAELARQEALRQQELKRQEEARLAAEREAARRAEEARIAAEKAEAERQAEMQRQQEAAKREAERLEVLRQEELKRQEEARLAAEREAARQAEQARVAAEKAEAERQAEIQRQQREAEREAERQAFLRQEIERQEAHRRAEQAKKAEAEKAAAEARRLEAERQAEADQARRLAEAKQPPPVQDKPASAIDELLRQAKSELKSEFGRRASDVIGRKLSATPTEAPAVTKTDSLAELLAKAKSELHQAEHIDGDNEPPVELELPFEPELEFEELPSSQLTERPTVLSEEADTSMLAPTMDSADDAVPVLSSEHTETVEFEPVEFESVELEPLEPEALSELEWQPLDAESISTDSSESEPAIVEPELHAAETLEIESPEISAPKAGDSAVEFEVQQNEPELAELPTVSPEVLSVPMLEAVAGGDEFEELESVVHEPLPCDLWVIGASLGGPAALKRFFAALNEPLPVCFLLVQHIDPHFLPVLGKILEGANPFYRVDVLSRPGLIEPGTILLAPVEKRLWFLDGAQVVHSPHSWTPPYSPCINDVLHDVAIAYPAQSHAIIFSGMGEDGVSGAEAMHRAGGDIWVQDAESCASAVMPDAIDATGIVSLRATPEQLAEKLTKRYLSKTQTQHA